jgi:Tol biopolymer transport system component
MTPTRSPLHFAIALALAGTLGFAAPAGAQDPPQPAPQEAEDRQQEELEQDALDPVGHDPQPAPLDTARGQRRPGEDAKDAKWDVNAAHGPVKTVAFSTSEGTWMDVDVSPDGRRIVFSLLGDLYVLPIGGGEATRITSGPAWDIQPRWSPDGRQLAFTSDRGGGNNLWRIGADGSNPVQVSKEDFRLLNTPAWTPDGRFLVGRKHFTSQRSLGAGELWLYHASGEAGGATGGLQLTKRKNDQQDLGEPAVSPDGRYVYFSEDVSPGPTFQYNKDPHGVIYAVKRLDRETGKVDTLVSTPGGAVRPQPSPDGKSLAFVKRVREKSVLHVMDLASGAVRPVWDGLSHDQQEAWAIFGPYTGFGWTPDSNSVVIWAQGGLWRVDMAGGNASPIPFTAQVEQTVAEPLRFEQEIGEGDFAPRMIRDVATSPDGRTLVFHAVGQLWKKRLPDGTPQRLTGSSGVHEYQPSFSADGRTLLYTTWSDEAQGAIHAMDAGGGRSRRLTTEPGFYYHPRLSPDGSRIVYSRAGGGGLTGSLWSGDRGIYVMPARGGTPVRVADNGQSPQFSADGSRVYYLTGGGMEKKLMSVGLHGEDPREVYNLKYVDAVSLSPDGKWVAFTELFNAYVTPLVDTGMPVELNKDSKALPVTRVSADVGSYLHWSGDSQSLHWMVGDRYFSRPLNQAFSFLPGAPAELPKPAAAQGVPVGLTVAGDAPSDTFAFTNARIVTMRDAENREEVIENGTLVVRGDSIVAVGPSSQVQVPAGARAIDASGKTIIPGIIDVHAHAAHFGQGVVPQQNWAYYANLAFGVTTLHDPSATTEFVFSQAELLRAGRMVGPRVFSTGTILYGADGELQGRDQVARRRPRAPAADAGQRRVLGQELQPAAPRPAPAGQPGRARAGDAGGRGRRFDLPPQHDHGPGRCHRHRAQHPGRAAVPGRARPVVADRRAHHPDPRGELRRPVRRVLVVRARQRVGGPQAQPLLPARDPGRARDPPRDRAGLGLLAHRGGQGQEGAARRGGSGPGGRPRPAAGPGDPLGDLDAGPGRVLQLRGAARGHHRRRRLHRPGPPDRFTGGRQAGRPGGAGRQPSGQHPRHRRHPLRDGRRPAVRRGRGHGGDRQPAHAGAAFLLGAAPQRAGVRPGVRTDRAQPLPQGRRARVPRALSLPSPRAPRRPR